MTMNEAWVNAVRNAGDGRQAMAVETAAKAATLAEVESVYREAGFVVKRSKKAMVACLVGRIEGLALAAMRGQLIRSI